MIGTWEQAMKLLKNFDIDKMPDTFWPERGVDKEVMMKLAVNLSAVYHCGLPETLALLQIGVIFAEEGARPSLEVVT